MPCVAERCWKRLIPSYAELKRLYVSNRTHIGGPSGGQPKEDHDEFVAVQWSEGWKPPRNLKERAELWRPRAESNRRPTV